MPTLVSEKHVGVTSLNKPPQNEARAMAADLALPSAASLPSAAVHLGQSGTSQSAMPQSASVQMVSIGTMTTSMHTSGTINSTFRGFPESGERAEVLEDEWRHRRRLRT